MEEQVRPEEEPTEVTGQADTPGDRLKEMVVDLRDRTENLGYEVQGKVKELGSLAGERTREAVEQIRYFSDQARTEAASRLEETGHRLTGMAEQWGENSRAVVRERPGMALGLAVLAGFVLAMLGRRLVAGRFRR
ncbi:MAG: hypothetical protein HYX94_04675 [Chloroflexi bacterium]|nr:hypothetical protein [Chloroflexota bacterium]